VRFAFGSQISIIGFTAPVGTTDDRQILPPYGQVALETLRNKIVQRSRSSVAVFNRPWRYFMAQSRDRHAQPVSGVAISERDAHHVCFLKEFEMYFQKPLP
jgi:hypothetical protein